MDKVRQYIKAVRWLTLLWTAIVIVAMLLAGAPLWASLAIGLWVLYKEQ